MNCQLLILFLAVFLRVDSLSSPSTPSSTPSPSSLLTSSSFSPSDAGLTNHEEDYSGLQFYPESIANQVLPEPSAPLLSQPLPNLISEDKRRISQSQSSFLSSSLTSFASSPSLFALKSIPWIGSGLFLYTVFKKRSRISLLNENGNPLLQQKQQQRLRPIMKSSSPEPNYNITMILEDQKELWSTLLKMHNQLLLQEKTFEEQKDSYENRFDDNEKLINMLKKEIKTLKEKLELQGKNQKDNYSHLRNEMKLQNRELKQATLELLKKRERLFSSSSSSLPYQSSSSIEPNDQTESRY